MKRSETYVKCIMVIFGILFPVLVWCMGLLFQVPCTDLSDSVKLTYSDEAVADYTVHIENTLVDKDKAYNLMFQTSGCTVTVYNENNIIFKYGHQYADAGLSVGPAYLSVPLPSNMLASDVRIHLEKQDSSASMKVIKVQLCLNSDSTRYYLTNGSLVLPMAFVFFIISICGMLIYSSMRIKYKEDLSGLYVFGVALCFSLILLAQEGHFLIFTSNQHSYHYIVHISRYLIPTFLALFSRRINERRTLKALLLLLAVTESALLLISMLFEYIGFAHICDLNGLFIASVILCAVVGLYEIYYNYKDKKISLDITVFFAVLAIWSIGISLISHTIRIVSHERIVAFSNYTVMSMAFFYTICFSLFKHVHETHDVRVAKENQIQRLEADLMKSRLKNINNQTRPHFLFNVINAIQEVVFVDQAQAATMLGDFAVHLRSIIRMMDDDREVHFREELKNIQAYVNIEKMRFRERLTVEYLIDADDFLIIPLGIQPLVENAIRHGIYHKGPSGGKVIVTSKEEDAYWVIQVIDDGVGFSTEDVLQDIRHGDKDSTGLKNLVYRFENLMKAKVIIESAINVGTTVTVQIPKTHLEKKHLDNGEAKHR